MISFFKCGEQGHLAGLHTKKKETANIQITVPKRQAKAMNMTKKKKKITVH